MSNDTTKETAPGPANDDGKDEAEQERKEQPSSQSGPTFTKGPDPLRGVKKGVDDLMGSMEGKTVSMKVYVGTIAGVVLLMLLARCGD